MCWAFAGALAPEFPVADRAGACSANHAAEGLIFSDYNNASRLSRTSNKIADPIIRRFSSRKNNAQVLMPPRLISPFFAVKNHRDRVPPIRTLFP